ncbi:hypothetical protein V8F20_006768 [Naviculisporaceae sp. PSN 640]
MRGTKHFISWKGLGWLGLTYKAEWKHQLAEQGIDFCLFLFPFLYRQLLFFSLLAFSVWSLSWIERGHILSYVCYGSSTFFLALPYLSCLFLVLSRQLFPSLVAAFRSSFFTSLPYTRSLPTFHRPIFQPGGCCIPDLALFCLACFLLHVSFSCSLRRDVLYF